MLWSLVKVLIFVAVVAGIVFGMERIIAQGEGIRIIFAGTEVTLDPLQTVIAALLLFVAVWIVIRLVGLLYATLRFILGDETAFSRFFSRFYERRGHQALNDGMLALAAGDTKLALRKAVKADNLLGKSDVAGLLAAQAAEQAGDKTLALESYKKLLGNDKTRFIAVRGMMRHRQAEGDEGTARELAQKALEMRPQDEETADQLFLMQTHDKDWSGARKTLGLKKRHKSAPKDMAKRRDGLLALCEARDARADGDLETAQKAALEAVGLLPNFAPAVVEGARAALENGNKTKAASMIRAAWAAEPHPSLAAAYAELEPNETPAQRVKRFNDLVRKDPSHSEARMVMTEVNLAAEDFPAARRALGDLVESDPTARVMTLMAAIERGEGSDERAVKAWLAKAVTAPRGPQWVCEADGAVYKEWQPVCDLCGAFDTLSWKPAPTSEVMPDSSAGMLPLIVGALEDQSAAEAEAAETVESSAEETAEKV